MQKKFYFIRTNGQLKQISQEEYEWGLEYQAYYEQDLEDESEMWDEFNI